MRSNGRPNGNGRADWRDDPKVFAELVGEALEAGTRRAVAEHHRAGDPVAVWKEGEIVLLYPDGSTRPLDPAPASGE